MIEINLVFFRCIAPEKGTILPQRVVLGIMGFLGIVVSFLMRACLSVAITEMVVPVNNTGISNESLICQTDYTSLESANNTRVVCYHSESEYLQSYILPFLNQKKKTIC